MTRPSAVTVERVGRLQQQTAALNRRMDELQAQADALTGDPCPLCGLWHWGTCLEHAVRVYQGAPSDRHEQLRHLLDESRAVRDEAARSSEVAAELRRLLG